MSRTPPPIDPIVEEKVKMTDLGSGRVLYVPVDAGPLSKSKCQETFLPKNLPEASENLRGMIGEKILAMIMEYSRGTQVSNVRIGPWNIIVHFGRIGAKHKHRVVEVRVKIYEAIRDFSATQAPA